MSDDASHLQATLNMPKIEVGNLEIKETRHPGVQLIPSV